MNEQAIKIKLQAIASLAMEQTVLNFELVGPAIVAICDDLIEELELESKTAGSR
jgi:hypothetical protein